MLQRIIRSSIVFSIAALILIAVGYFYTYPQVVRCYTINLSAFEEHPNRIYTSKGTTAAQQKALFNLINQSQQRITAFWERKKSTPIIIFCHSDTLYQLYGSRSGSPANYFGTPVGSYVVISPDGLNADVISHEMCHAELTERIGWLMMTIKIPQWFNEGLALMVDFRFPGNGIDNSYNHYRQKWNEVTYGGKFEMRLEELQEVESFLQADNYHQYLAYLRSGMEVSRWLKQAERKGLLQLIQKIDAGADFDTAYKQVEQKSNK